MSLVRVSTPPDPATLGGYIAENFVSDVVLAPGAISAAYQMIDGPTNFIGRAIFTQTWDLTLDRFEDRIRIPLPPLQTINSIQYVDANGVEQTLAPDRYKVLLSVPARVVPAYGQPWPTTRCEPGAVTIRFTCGYGNAPPEIPDAIIQAIVLQARQMGSLTERNLFLRSETVDGVGERQFTVSDAAGNAMATAVKNLLQPYRVYG